MLLLVKVPATINVLVEVEVKEGERPTDKQVSLAVGRATEKAQDVEDVTDYTIDILDQTTLPAEVFDTDGNTITYM